MKKLQNKLNQQAKQFRPRKSQRIVYVQPQKKSGRVIYQQPRKQN